MTIRLASAAAAVALFSASLHAGQTGASNVVEKTFVKGGTIRMKLVAGDYRITGRSDERIRIEWRTDRSEDAASVRADAEIKGATAMVATTGPKNGLHFSIDVPARSDIEVDLSAGDLEIRGIEGNKKVDSWAGDVSIDIGQPDQYRQVEASVRAGDLNARPFNVSKGGLLRSFSWTGKGPYSLYVKLFAGDLTLR